MRPKAYFTSLLTGCMCLVWISGWTQVDRMRTLFEKAANDRQSCRLLLDLAERSLGEADAVKKPLYRGYLGAAEAVWANHANGPFAKWRTFKQGTGKLDSAIIQRPELLELRYLRLRLQRHAPVFLGYKGKMAEDEGLLRAHNHRLDSDWLREQVLKILD